MTFDMNAEKIHQHGRGIRERCNVGEVVATRFSPGNMTMYELMFTPAPAIVTWATTPGEPLDRDHLHDCIVSKMNGTPRLTWAIKLPLLTGGLYWDPGYLAANLNCTAGDVLPLGLLINAVSGVPLNQLNAAYVGDDGLVPRQLSEDVIAACQRR